MLMFQGDPVMERTDLKETLTVSNVLIVVDGTAVLGK